jgi:2-phospho-L-lactate guanylyltransferase
MSVWAMIPVKAFTHAKSRLEGILDDQQRQDFARTLFAHVLDQVKACASIEDVLVLTNGDDVAAFASKHGAQVLQDDPAWREHSGAEGHLGRVVDAGMTYLATRGIQSALVLMADLPHLTRADVESLAERARTHAMVIAPDHQERGTNALALSPPDCMRTCFGHVDSTPRHLARAGELGHSVSIYRSPSTALDIDRPQDLSGVTGTTRKRSHARGPGTASRK